MRDIVILQTCAAGISAPALTNELLRCGADVLGGDMDISTIEKMDPSPFEYCVQLPSPKDEKAYIEAIQKATWKENKRGRRLIVFPHNQDEMTAISNYLNILPKRDPLYALVQPEPLATLDKANLYDRLSAIDGILGAPDWRILQPEDIFRLEDCRIEGVFEGKTLLKPVDGCGSAGIIRTIHDEYILCDDLSKKGMEEYTIDALSYGGRLLDYCARKRLKAHGGICVDALVLGHDKFFGEAAQKFVEAFNCNGPLALQGFKGKEDRLYVTDCNHRFGGGVGMSIMAGWQGVAIYVDLMHDRKHNGLMDYGIPKTRVRRWYREEVVEV